MAPLGPRESVGQARLEVFAVKRRFEFVSGSSRKFWEIELCGAAYVTTYGRIVSEGQETISKFASSAEAQEEYDKIVSSKVRKGYRQVSGSAWTVAVPEPPKAPPAAGTGFPGPWRTAPLAAGVIRELLRLGCRMKQPFSPDAPRPLSKLDWDEEETDAIDSVPAAVWTMLRLVQWKRKKFSHPDGEILIERPAKSDTYIEDRRCLLSTIGRNFESRCDYALNLLEEGDDPPVYSIDHDGSEGYAKWPRLSEYLATLR